MHSHTIRLVWLVVLILVLILTLVGCGRDNDTPQESFVQANAGRTAVTLRQAGVDRNLGTGEIAQLLQGDGVTVDETGQAILRFSDFLTVEVLRDGDLLVRELSLAEQSALAVFAQTGGTFVNDMSPGAAGVERRVTIETEFAVITATGTRFMIAREANSPLEWVFGLDAGPDDLYVWSRDMALPADGLPGKPVESGQARWIAPIGEPSPGINYNLPGVRSWLRNIEEGESVTEVGNVLWPQADLRLRPMQPDDDFFDGELSSEGLLTTLVEQSDFGRATYEEADCNDDGIPDLVVRNGQIRWDFRNMMSRVSQVDVTLLGLDGGAQGSLEVFDPAFASVQRLPFSLAAGEAEIISLSSDQPYHYAQLSLAHGCYLGVSLTPQPEPGRAAEARPAVDSWQPRPATRPTPTPTPALSTRPTPTPTPTVTPTAAFPTPYVRIDQPEDGSRDVRNGFTLAGQSSFPFEGNLNIFIETEDGKLIQEGFVTVEMNGGEPYSADPAFFRTQIDVDAELPMTVRVRVLQLSAADGSVITEDSILLDPLLPEEAIYRPESQGVLPAWPLWGYTTTASPRLEMDGDPREWVTLQRLTNADLIPIEHTIDFPGSLCDIGQNPDFTAYAQLAYDIQYLYVAFWVRDEAFHPYTGSDLRFFLGDSPQLLLDLDLAGDYDERVNSRDDIQIDLHPGFEDDGELYGARATLWELSATPLRSRLMQSVRIGSSLHEEGYFVEAAIPWAELGVQSLPPTLGAVLAVSNNDNPEQNRQECMIATSPVRDWRNPTTWGTMVLRE